MSYLEQLRKKEDFCEFEKVTIHSMCHYKRTISSVKMAGGTVTKSTLSQKWVTHIMPHKLVITLANVDQFQ